MDKCKICGNCTGKRMKVKDRLLNEKYFNYFYCKKCGTIQLVDDVNVGDYYPDNYYSYITINKRFFIPGIICKIALLICTNLHDLPFLLKKIFYRVFPMSMTLYQTNVRLDAKILDVGGGNGLMASWWGHSGFKNVMSIDPYTSHTPFTNIKFSNCTITDLNEENSFDLITMFSSFEHMRNPVEVLRKAYRLLTDEGGVLIKIPVSESQAWKEYGEYWYQLDAPRHFFLYTERAIRHLCKKTGFKLKWVNYHSDMNQFLKSKLYKETSWNIGKIQDYLKEMKKKEMKPYIKCSDNVEKIGLSDTAFFYLAK